MQSRRSLLHIALLTGLLAGLGGCTITPANPVGYYGPPVVVETYPVYRYGYPYRYYDYDRRGGHVHDHRSGRDYRDDRRRYDSPFDNAARSHREIRRSLGLPRLPGMP